VHLFKIFGLVSSRPYFNYKRITRIIVQNLMKKNITIQNNINHRKKIEYQLSTEQFENLKI